MNAASRWAIAALAALLLGSTYLLDGPNEFEADLDTAAAARDIERTDLSERIASKGTP